MVVPWQLVWRLAAAIAVGVVALFGVGARRERLNVTLDVVLSRVLGAVVGGRLMVLALDVALLGALPDPRALLGLGPGLSVPGALLGATVAGWRRRGVPVGVWADVGVGVAAGLAGFAAVHLPGGLAANVVRAVGLSAGAVWLWRADASRWHPGLRLLAVVSTVHLVSSALVPSLPTGDTDLDVVLTLVVGVGAMLTHPRVAASVRRIAGVAMGLLGAVVVLSAVLSVPAESVLPSGSGAGSGSASGSASASLVGAIVGGSGSDGPGSGQSGSGESGSGSGSGSGESGGVPAWGGEELAAFVEGQDLPVVVNLWASWCPPCHAEAAAVGRAARALEGRAVVLGVLVDDDPADGQEFADRYGLGFPTVVDAGVSDAVGMAGLPTTVVLSADGSVVQRVVGGVSQGTLADAVERAGSAG